MVRQEPVFLASSRHCNSHVSSIFDFMVNDASDGTRDARPRMFHAYANSRTAIHTATDASDHGFAARNSNMNDTRSASRSENPQTNPDREPNKPPPEKPWPAPHPEQPLWVPAPTEPPVIDPPPDLPPQDLPPPIESRLSIARVMNACRRLQGTLADWTIAGSILTLTLLSSGTPAGDKSRVASESSATTKQTDFLATDGQRSRSTLDEALKFAETSRQALQEVKDYTAVFSKTELVGGRIAKHSMDMKFRQQPFSVYLRCRSKPDAGREVIFVAGENDGKLSVREAGLKAIIGVIELAPDDPRVMDVNRRPITQIGISNLLEIETSLWREDRQSHPDNVEVTFVSGAKIGSTACDLIEIRHLKPTSDQQFYLSRVYFDRSTKFPIQVEHFDWPDPQDPEPPQIEEYTYTDIQTNVGLSNFDFDTQNPEYSFRKRR